jgi:hypothetical protein
MLKAKVVEQFFRAFGQPVRERVKVKAFRVLGIEVVVEIDQPKRQDACNVWLPYPPDGQEIPEMALEYPGEAGRHSGTYASEGLKKGLPALKLVLTTERELAELMDYIRALAAGHKLPSVSVDTSELKQANDDVRAEPIRIDVSSMPAPKPPAPKREAIPRSVQREVWQRDAGMCVECGTRQLLCFDHIVPFSRGGSNTVRNLQLLCEPCNLSKGNRI